MTMNPTDLADATARALDLLDSNDPANSDPRLFREPCLTNETRLTREAAAAVWLAVSPLHVAPAEVLPELMEKIGRSRMPGPKNDSRLMPWLAASGWAAAAALAMILWPREVPSEAENKGSGLTQKLVLSEKHHENPLPPTYPTSREVRIRHEIARLQERLTTAQRDRANLTPRVISLTAPGTPHRTEEESRKRVQTILTDALRSTLEAESAASSDPATLVIERGWLPRGLPLPADDGIIRHRNFPEHAWLEMGLLRSESGEFYDSAANTVWSADPAGRGFIGRKATADEDISRFSDNPDSSPPIAVKPRTVPEGFIIKSAEADTAEVVIDQVPAPAAGTQHFVIVTDPSGHTETIPVTPTDPAPLPDGQKFLAQSDLTPAGVGQQQSVGVMSLEGVINFGTIVLTLQNFSSTNSLQLIERPYVPNGQPDKVIVESGP
jgi:hypothetical protein